MTLNLALVISGDPSGAKRAVDETRASVKALGADSAQASATIAAAEQTAQAARQRTINQLLAQGAAAKSATALASYEVTNLTRQFSDLGVMLATGQSPLMAMITQGPQIADIFGRRGLTQIIGGVGAALASMVNPTTIALAGITAFGYGASYVFEALRGDIRSVDEVMAEHADLIDRIAARWPEAGAAAKRYAADSAAVLIADRQAAQKDYTDAILSEQQKLFDAFKSRPAGDFGPSTPMFGEFSKSLDELERAVREKKPGILDFFDRMAKIETSPYATDAQRELARSIRESGSEGADAEKKLKALNATMSDGAAQADVYTRNMTGLVAALNSLDRIAAPDLSRREQALKAYQEAISKALGYEDRLAARKSYDSALTRIENEEAGARVPVPTPRPNLEDTLPSGRNMLQSQTAQLERLRLEAMLVGASEAAHARLTAQLEAEQEIRALGIDSQGDQANAIRANADAIAEASVALDRSTDAWDRYRSAGERAVDDVLGKLTSGDWKGALDSLSKDVSKFLQGMTVSNPIKNALFGTNYGTMSDLGSGGGLLGRLFGGAGSPAASVFSATAPIAVTAAVVNI